MCGEIKRVYVCREREKKRLRVYLEIERGSVWRDKVCVDTEREKERDRERERERERERGCVER